MSITPFNAITFSDDDSQLTVAWLPEPNARLLMGITSSGSAGSGLVLSSHDSLFLFLHLEKGDHWTLPEEKGGPVRATPSNRGEPYREGFDISIGTEASLFLEAQDVARLIEFLGNPPVVAA